MRLNPLTCFQLDNLWVSNSATTSIHRDETSDPLGCIEVCLEHHTTAHTVPNEDGWLQLQGAQKRTDVGAIGFNVAVCRIAGGRESSV